MTSILLPATDTAVVVDALVLAAVTTGLLLALRRKPAARACSSAPRSLSGR